MVARAEKVVPLKPDQPRKRLLGLWDSLLSRALNTPKRGRRGARTNPFVPALPMPNVVGEGATRQVAKLAMDIADHVKLAMDSGEGMAGAGGSWLGGFAQNYFASEYEEGMTWLGYAVLALLSQRAEYRIMTDTIATEMTREGIAFRSKSDDKSQKDRIERIEARFRELDVQGVMKAANLNDGFQGRGQVYVDTGVWDDREELKFPLSDIAHVRAKHGNGKFIKRLGAIEPMWTYPAAYEASDPLKPDWYTPTYWWVMGKEVHRDRLLTFVGNPVPDMLKPAYSFGGLSLTQMAKPYVDFWLRNRTSESDLLNNFSVMVLMTDLDVTTMDEGSELFQRAMAFNALRDNQGLMLINKSTEDFKNVSAALGGVADIVRQSMERLTLPAQIPIVKFFGNQPSGLNADSEGVIRLFYDGIKAKQESRNRKPMQTVFELVQIEEFGEVIEDFTWDFNDLWQLDEAGKSAIQKTKSDQRAVDIQAGVVTPDEAREALAKDKDSQYAALDLSDPLPEPQLDPGADPSAEPEETGETPGEPAGPKPNRRDFAPGLTSQAAKFGGAVSGGFQAHDVEFDLALDAALAHGIVVPTQAHDKGFEWEEKLHPRGDGGKFAKAGTASPTLHKMLTEKGFKQHPESPHAIYTHGSGHQVAFAPKTQHNEHSYQWAAYKDYALHPDKSTKGQVQGTSKQMKEMLGKLLPSGAQPETQTAQEPALEPPPGAQFKGFDMDVFTYLMPDGSTLYTDQGGGWAIPGGSSGNGQQSLNEHLGVAPAASATMPTSPTGDPPVAEGELWGKGWKDYDLPKGQKLTVFSNGKWTIKDDDGEFVPIASGTGQASLNAAFEKLHPRDSSGKFLAKFKPLEAVGFSVSQADNPDGSGTVSISKSMPSGGFVMASWQPDKSVGYATAGPGEPAQKFTELDAFVGYLKMAAGTPAPEKQPVGKTLDFGDLKEVGPQLGSNPGGQYEDAAGNRLYVKMPKSNDHAKNELLAAALFGAAGGQTLGYHGVGHGDKVYVGTDWEPLAKSNVSQLTPSERKRAQGDFAIQAWLANWDAAGLTGDNVGVSKGGKVMPLDFGGSLLYRAQGAPKGDKFDAAATEWESLRDPAKNPSTSSLYAGMTDQDLRDSAARLSSLTDDKIAHIVQQHGPGTPQERSDLASKLVKRRDAILKKASEIGKAPVPPKVTPEAENPSALRSKVASWDPPGKPKGAVSDYKGQGSKPMNAMIRSIDMDSIEEEDSDYAKKIVALRDWLGKAATKEDMAVFHGIPSNDYAAQWMSNAKVGRKMRLDGFSSTSTSEEFSTSWAMKMGGTGVLLKIKAPKGSKMATVTGSDSDGEYEVLAQVNSRFKVTKITGSVGGVYVIEGELDQSHL